MSDQLTAIEKESLQMCEEKINRGLNTFYEVGRALIQIRDQYLYREMYSTFEEYCRKRWQISSRYAQLLSGATQTIDNLRTNCSHLPENEAQVRPLVSLEPEEQKIVWQIVQETAPNGKVSSGHVKSIVNTFKDVLTGAIDGGDGIDIPIAQATTDHVKAAVNEELQERLKRQEGYIDQKSNGKAGNGHLKPLMTSKSDKWNTPEHIIHLVCKVMEAITLDPCSNSKTNPNVPAVHHFTSDDNGLSQEWHGSVYMNPPYGDEIAEWVAKLVESYELGHVHQAIALLPARTDTAWMRMLADYPRCFIWGRLHFSNSKNAATFPSVVVYLGEETGTFARVFQTIGDIYIKWGTT